MFSTKAKHINETLRISAALENRRWPVGFPLNLPLPIVSTKLKLRKRRRDQKLVKEGNTESDSKANENWVFLIQISGGGISSSLFITVTPHHYQTKTLKAPLTFVDSVCFKY